MSEFAGNPMGQQESIFVAATSGRFFRPKETGYNETPKKVKIIWLVVIAVLLLAVIVFLVLRASSFERVLSNADLDDWSVRYLDRYESGQRNSTDKVTAYFYTKTVSDGKLALVHATRNFWGFWSIKDVVKARDDTGIGMSWEGEAAGQYAWDAMDEPMQIEYHYAYIGENALRRVVIKEEQLPVNAAVRISQSYNEYQIHVVHISIEGEVDVDFGAILRENGCIPQESNLG